MLASLYSDGKVSTLITHNVDYLSHHVMLKLRHAHRNPSVLSVLSVIMSHSSLDMISSLHEIIDDVSRLIIKIPLSRLIVHLTYLISCYWSDSGVGTKL